MTVLVTGTGRCGTTWARDVLLASRVRATHQAIRHEHVLGRIPFPALKDVEVSYEAAPMADVPMWERVIVLVRHPFLVARSWVALNAFDDDGGFFDLHDSIRVHCPAVFDYEEPMLRALAFWVEWNLLALPHADFAAAVETLEPDVLVAECGFQPRYQMEGSVAIRRDVNHLAEHKKPIPPATAGDIPAAYKDRLADLAYQFGYDL